MPASLNADFSASPVMMPGSAMRQHEQQRDRVAPEEAEPVDPERDQDPSTSAMAVATRRP